MKPEDEYVAMAIAQALDRDAEERFTRFLSRRSVAEQNAAKLAQKHHEELIANITSLFQETAPGQIERLARWVQDNVVQYSAEYAALMAAYREFVMRDFPPVRLTIPRYGHEDE
jgi:phosphoribosylanthranilate isomerase